VCGLHAYCACMFLVFMCELVCEHARLCIDSTLVHSCGKFQATPPHAQRQLRGRVGQNRLYAPYMTVYLVISLPKIPYIHRLFIYTPSAHIYIYIYIFGSGQPCSEVIQSIFEA